MQNTWCCHNKLVLAQFPEVMDALRKSCGGNQCVIKEKINVEGGNNEKIKSGN